MSTAQRRLMATLATMLLITAWCGELVQMNPLQTTVDSRPRSYNKTCITENIENGTHLTIISSSMVTSNGDADQQSPTAQFNERRRDMFFENYNIKQVEVIDTSVISNRSSNATLLRPAPSGLSTNQTVPSVIVSSTLVSVGTVREPSHEAAAEDVPVPVLPQRPNVLMPKLDPSGRPACVRSPDDTFCETVNNYPNQTKNDIDLTPQQFNDIFGIKIDGRKSPTVDPEDHNEESVCRKVPRVIYPQMAKNQANQWVYVVNEIEYTQAVVAELCEKPGVPCTHLESMPLGMFSRCKQKYSYKRLLALHPTEKRTYPDSFKFPSCCSCYVKYDELARSNGRTIPIGSKDPVGEQGRDSRAMTPADNHNNNTETVIETQSILAADNSTIEIMSQSADLTSAGNVTQISTGNNDTVAATSPAAVSQ